jgi:hypothetical protein
VHRPGARDSRRGERLHHSVEPESGRRPPPARWSSDSGKDKRHEARTFGGRWVERQGERFAQAAACLRNRLDPDRRRHRAATVVRPRNAGARLEGSGTRGATIEIIVAVPDMSVNDESRKPTWNWEEAPL